MAMNLREKRTHGTTFYPLHVYSHHDKDGFYSVAPHWHEELEWIYAETGVLDLRIQGKSYTLQEGEFCFINAEELHEIRSEGESLHHAIVFRGDFLDFERYDSCEHQFIRPITNRLLAFPTLSKDLPVETRGDIAACLRELIQCYHAKPPCYALHIKILIFQVLEQLYQAQAFTDVAHSSRQEESWTKLKRVISYMQDNYAQPLTLQELAQQAYLSPPYFCHFFHKATGMSPIAFLNCYRIQRAAQMLAQQDTSIAQIAMEVGFDNQSYFIRKFREYKRVSPREYRRQVRQA